MLRSIRGIRTNMSDNYGMFSLASALQSVACLPFYLFLCSMYDTIVWQNVRELREVLAIYGVAATCIYGFTLCTALSEMRAKTFGPHVRKKVVEAR